MKRFRRIFVLLFLFGSVFNLNNVNIVDASTDSQCRLWANQEARKCNEDQTCQKIWNDYYKECMSENIDPVENINKDEDEKENQYNSDYAVTTYTQQNTVGSYEVKPFDFKAYQNARGCKVGGKTVNGTDLDYDGICDDEQGQGFFKLMEYANRIIKWLVEISVLIAAAAGVWGGFLYLTSAANPSKRQEANAIFMNIFYGLIFIFAAWFIVWMILNVFAVGGGEGGYSGLNGE